MKSHRSGSVAVLAALAFVVLFALVVLGLDYTTFLSTKQQLQRSLDAAALAGVGRTDGDALELAKVNPTLCGPAVVDGLVRGRWRDGALSTDPAEFQDSLQVSGHVSCRGTFFGIVDVHATATARAGQPRTLVFRAANLSMAGGARVTAPDGDFAVGDSGDCVFATADEGTIVDAHEIRLWGNSCLAGPMPGPIVQARAMEPDPCADWAEPDPRAMTARGAIVGVGTYGPGRYDALVLDAGQVVLRPGTYAFRAFHLFGNGRLSAPAGVTILFEPGCKVTIEDHAEADFGEDSVLFQSRSNPLPFLIRDLATFTLRGTLYAPIAKLQMSGIGTRRFRLVSCGTCTVRDAGKYWFSAQEKGSVFLVR